MYLIRYESIFIPIFDGLLHVTSRGAEGLESQSNLPFNMTPTELVKLKDGVTFHGPIITAGEIRLDENVALTYTEKDQAAVSAVTLGTSSP